VNTPLFPDIPAHHLVFELRERDHPVRFTDDLAVHVLELPKFRKTAAELVTPLDVWLYFLKHGEDLDTAALPPALAAVPEIHRAMGELQMIAQNDVEREQYEARLKAQRDLSTALAEAHDEGRKKVLVQQIRFLQSVLRRAQAPMPELLARSPDELEHQLHQLQADLSRSLPASS
jgi:predicted transposase/invertase (TIGR01784 family)